MIAELIAGMTPGQALKKVLLGTELPDGLYRAIQSAPERKRGELTNSGWARHTVESAVWGLVNSLSFEEAVVKVANLGNDADTAASVTGALAGAAYGLSGIPDEWRIALHGEYPRGSGQLWLEQNFIYLADRLAGLQ